MIRHVVLAAMVAVIAIPACKGKSKDAAGAGSESSPSYNDTPYGRDVDRICNVERLSGAYAEEEGYRSMATAMWLADNIESEEGRLLTAKVRQAETPADKIAVLEEEMKRVGLPFCDLIAAWSGDSVTKPDQAPEATGGS